VIWRLADPEDGISVTDVWETQAQFEQFAQQQIGPFTQEVGFEALPELTYDDVHSHFTAG
jgi:hypothetical protein